jgi:PilZ domain-containing protein
VTSLTKSAPTVPQRRWPRYSNLKDLSLSYEGRSEVFPIRPPDISPTGMFINTSADFPEGAILKVSFRLAKSNHPIDVRCEVRYCLAGVGIGVEFVNMHPDDQKAIAKETHTPGLSFKPQNKIGTNHRKVPATKRSVTSRKKQTTHRKKKR